MKKILNIIVYILNLILLVTPVVLEKLSKTKMGVHRYVIAKNIKIQGMLNINFLKLIFIASIVIGLILLLYKNRKYKKISVLMIMILGVIGTVFTFNDFNLKSYYFFLLAICINIALGYINLILSKIKNKLK